VRGNAVGQRQELAQPGFVLVGEVLDADPVVMAEQRAAERDHDDVLQGVQLVAGFAAWVGESAEVGLGIGRHDGARESLFRYRQSSSNARGM